ncbi:alpha-glucuronidase [Halomicrobium zhouii]|uniref:Alpha-glucuronidase n=1 Tax=Halomicrobium zhouii TaxID=767519 RepID=A0A1I6KKS0_9EURY|nr:alpha-glucuronidase family glycosyl hydrolase [Halomicrobium zhouii]SFR91480.1 alpha-glucuronidase [Halomicrobium zhouii]
MLDADYDECWLRYPRVDDADRRESYARRCLHVYAGETSPQHGAIRDELREGLEGILGREPHLWQHPPRSADGFLVVGQPDLMEVVADSVDAGMVRSLDDDGYHLRSTTWEGAEVTVVTAPTDRGLVYGTFHLLRLMATGEPIDDLDVVEEPRNAERLINQWDEPFRGTVERGYGGESIFKWEHLPDLRERYFDYARLLASVGINGVVLNDVNTTRPERPGDLAGTGEFEGVDLLDEQHLPKVAALAAVFRRYGIRTYLSVNYASPMLVGDLDTADPLDDAVAAWWKDKVAEVYDLIPDFGGFLVKADSEGQPGPYDYDRSHAEGANVLGRAFEPYDGRVFWRAFVYSDHDDRAVQAHAIFEPQDGDFHEKVTVQVKNGPIDFQPREPVSTLFGDMPETHLACELQITQEYTGQGVHVCSHVPLWEEFFAFDTHADGEGTPVTEAFAGTEGEGIAGVGNVGEDGNWFGNYLSGVNLYGFGRLAWDPTLDGESVTEEWVRLTFGDDPEVVETVTDILQDSWEATVDYETGGLGLIHMMYNGEARLENHYDPAPAEWPGYTGATEDGIGYDRSSSGSDYVDQFADPVAERYDDPETCPDKLLLFFHHLPWDHELDDGRTVVQTLYDNCFAGVEEVKRLREQWRSLEGSIDEQRYRHVAERFDEQVEQAERWRDTLVEYFHDYSGVADERGRVPLAN